MAVLSDDVLSDIFLRLPRASIHHCRLVSKSWLSLLSDPCFVRRYRSLNPSLLGFYRYHKNSPFSCPQFIPTARSDDLRDAISRSPFSLEDLLPLPQVPPNHLRLFDSSNGLLLFYRFETNRQLFFFTCHPLTKQQVAFSSPSLNGPHCRFYLGFVSNPSIHSSSFRVVLVAASAAGTSRHEIHTFSSDTGGWSTALSSNCFCVAPFPSMRPAVYIDGVFYWEHMNDLILAYDEGSSHFLLIQLPVDRKPSCSATTAWAYDCLGKVEDSRLCYLLIAESHLYLWTLKDYFPQASWSLEQRVDLRALLGGFPRVSSEIARLGCSGTPVAQAIAHCAFRLAGFRGGSDPVVFLEVMRRTFSLSLQTRELRELCGHHANNVGFLFVLPYEMIVESLLFHAH